MTVPLNRWVLGLLVCTVSCGGFSTIAHAQGPRYSYVEGGWQSIELEDDGTFGDDLDGDGFAVGASFAVTDMLHIFASYGDSDLDLNLFGFDVNVGYSTLTAGAGLNFDVSETVDVVGQLAYVDAEVDVSVPGFGSASEDESGYGLAVGVRGMVTEDFELNASINYVDLGGDASDTTFSFGGVYSFTPVFALQAGFSFGDDVNSIGVGARLAFGEN
jgi:long-subunit fatty acid transport protein